MNGAKFGSSILTRDESGSSIFSNKAKSGSSIFSKNNLKQSGSSIFSTNKRSIWFKHICPKKFMSIISKFYGKLGQYVHSKHPDYMHVLMS